ncbi:kelch repeat-containing protein [Pseudomonas sp. NMS19W]
MVTGGSDGTTLRSSELYDAPSNRWIASADLKIPRFAHTATLLASGEVLVVGGNNLQPSGGDVLDSVERFDPATGQWTDMPSLPVARMNHTATLLETGQVLVAGGYSAAGNAALRSACIFDPQRLIWREIEPMPTLRMLQTATLLEDGRVLLAGELTNLSGYR